MARSKQYCHNKILPIRSCFTLCYVHIGNGEGVKLNMQYRYQQVPVVAQNVINNFMSGTVLTQFFFKLLIGSEYLLSF